MYDERERVQNDETRERERKDIASNFETEIYPRMEDSV
jgi:hypothetical protein